MVVSFTIMYKILGFNFVIMFVYIKKIKNKNYTDLEDGDGKRYLT